PAWSETRHRAACRYIGKGCTAVSVAPTGGTGLDSAQTRHPAYSSGRISGWNVRWTGGECVGTTGNLEAAREAVLAAIDAERDNLIALSKFIHANPEVALQEVKSSAACADFLAERGFSVERGVAALPTAFHASKGDGRPHVGYLSEYDAMPGVGHGCGHNLIAIAGIGAGIGLAAALA